MGPPAQRLIRLTMRSYCQHCIAVRAQASGSSLREAALASGSVSEAQFAEWVNPENKLGPTTSE